MARVLIFPGPSEAGGPLAAAAERISTCLVSRGHRVDVLGSFSALDAATQDDAHGVVIGARLVHGRLPEEVRGFLVAHGAWLGTMTSALFYVAQDRPDDLAARDDSARARTWSADDQAALAPILRYQSYGLFNRLTVFGPDSARAELSDWREVEALADRFADHLEAGMTVG